MTENEKDDLFYVCTLIEYVGRKTNNSRKAVVQALGEEGIKKQLHDACVNHCLTFEQVSDELIEKYGIQAGSFDTISDCKDPIPSVTSIGRLYSRLIMDCAQNDNKVSELFNVFTSFISDKISDFKTGIYFETPSYLECSYEAGYLLD